MDAKVMPFPLRFIPRGLRANLPRFRKHWNGKSPILTHLGNIFALATPLLEDAAIQAARDVFDQVQDPVLKVKLRVFLSQEDQRNMIQGDFKSKLKGYDLPVERCEDVLKNSLKLLDGISRYDRRLYIHAAVEHFATVSARLAISKEVVTTGVESEVVKMLKWYGLEGVEHKDVLFEALGALNSHNALPAYIKRLLGFSVSTITLTAAFTVAFLLMLLADRRSLSVRDLFYSVGYLMFKPGSLRKVVLDYLDYVKPGFHPNNKDDSRLIELATQEIFDKRISEEVSSKKKPRKNEAEKVL